jgi:hypothetical protein
MQPLLEFPQLTYQRMHVAAARRALAGVGRR